MEEEEQQARGEKCLVSKVDQILMSRNLKPFAMEIRKLEAEDFLKKTKIKINKEDKKERGGKDLRKHIFLQYYGEKSREIIKEIENEESRLWGHLTF